MWERAEGAAWRRFQGIDYAINAEMVHSTVLRLISYPRRLKRSGNGTIQLDFSMPERFGFSTWALTHRPARYAASRMLR